MTAGVGPVLSYGAKFGKVGFAAEVKWLPQVGAWNTLKGDLRLVQDRRTVLTGQ